ncbi:transglycosylase SLT domain-containing protein [Candidatus Woesearchaeota archaeon]|nr:transglycosylase SLT domain-containing protein [Candidatus Woesearchaeota archaeon]
MDPFRALGRNILDLGRKRRVDDTEETRREAAERAEAERRAAENELAQIRLREARGAEAARERQAKIERRRAEDEARQEERQRQSLSGRIGEIRDRVSGTKDAIVGRATEITINTAKSKTFWAWFLLGLILFFAAYYQFPSFRTFLLGIGISIAGLIAIFIIILFIIWGLWKGINGDMAALFIALALLVWMVDLAPEWIIPWPPYAGFELPLSFGVWSLSLLPVLTSSFTFAFLYINMVLKIIKKEWIYFSLAFILILIINYIFPKILPNSYLNFNFSIPGLPLVFIIVVMITVGIVWYFHKKSASAEISEFFSSLWMIFVFSFFWINNGWQNNIRAWIHVFYIIFFGFVYIKSKEKNNTVRYNIFFPTLLFIDFFGYGFLWNSEFLALRTLPPLVILVISYCYVMESNEIDGKKKATYPVLAFILLVTFFLIMTVKVAGLQENSLPFIAKQGSNYKDFYSQFTDNFKNLIESRLDIATAGLYRGNVEKNRYESLGVYFGNIRASDPRFYTDEPITVWGTLRSKTYKDAVIVNFNCSRWKDSKRIYADKIIPEIRFPIFTLEEVDTQCTFLPKPKNENPIPAGANIVTLSAEYNFGTDSYLKTYFMDRERFRASTREGVDPLTQFGIKDKTPGAVFTNGPVEIGLGAGPLVTVSEGYAIKPTIDITLTNRKEIQDKDKKIITRWEGKIKNITELILLTPYGVTLGTPDKLEKCKDPKTDLEKLECPCSMPFSSYDEQKCYNSCVEQVLKPCNTACASVNKDSKDQNAEIRCNNECGIVNDRCLDECRFLFKVEEGEGPTQEKYNAYALDVSSKQFKDLNKDIDKSRSFVCRFEPSSAVLDNTPITTRYFRVRARYNYLLENSVTVNVESVPVGAINTVPDSVAKITLDIRSGGPLWFDGYSSELISAIASVESKFKHCCQDATKNRAENCVDSGLKECPFENLITSGSSFGIMQIKYNTAQSKKDVDNLAVRHCEGKSINNYDCNVKVGIAILKSKYEQFRYGCKATSEYKSQDRIKYKTFIDGCENGASSTGIRYDSYRNEQAAIRGYNGWGADSRFDINYVEKVLRAKTTVKGREITDSSTLGGINRQGPGMSDATPIESEETQTLENINQDFYSAYISADFIQGFGVNVTWNKGGTENFGYKITRIEQDQPQSSTYICSGSISGTREGKCTDKSYQSGRAYVYKLELVSVSTQQKSEAVSNIITVS